MLRITPIGAAPAAAFRLEGKLVEPWVAELRALFEVEGAAGATLRLDLAAVGYVDGAGIGLLRELIGKGVLIAPRSGYVAALLEREFQS